MDETLLHVLFSALELEGIRDRVLGCTERLFTGRANEIREFAEGHSIDAFVAVDDSFHHIKSLDETQRVHTSIASGLNDEKAQELLEKLQALAAS